jgi:hypothetical protein
MGHYAQEPGWVKKEKEMSEWRDIETAPKDKNILLFGRYWHEEQGWFNEPIIGRWRDERWEAVWRSWFAVRPTHWMPLPNIPENVGGVN